MQKKKVVDFSWTKFLWCSNTPYTIGDLMLKPGRLWYNRKLKQYLMITEIDEVREKVYFYWLDIPNNIDKKPRVYFIYSQSDFMFIS